MEMLIGGINFSLDLKILACVMRPTAPCPRDRARQGVECGRKIMDPRDNGGWGFVGESGGGRWT